MKKSVGSDEEKDDSPPRRMERSATVVDAPKMDSLIEAPAMEWIMELDPWNIKYKIFILPYIFKDRKNTIIKIFSFSYICFYIIFYI